MTVNVGEGVGDQVKVGNGVRVGAVRGSPCMVGTKVAVGLGVRVEVAEKWPLG